MAVITPLIWGWGVGDALTDPLMWGWEAGTPPSQSEYPSEPEVALTPAEIAALVTAGILEVGYGARLIGAYGQPLEDITADLVGGEIEHHNYADIHGTCRISLSRELAWLTDRVLVYQTLTSSDYTLTQNLSVYTLTTPEMQIGERPTTYDVLGYDKLQLFAKPVGDTYVVSAGTGYLEAVYAVFAAAGLGSAGTINIDSSAVDKTLSEPMVWGLDPASPTTYLTIVNDLLEQIGYRGLWCDGTGAYRSEPYQSPAERAPSWTLDTSDQQTCIVGESRSLTMDVAEPTNWWRFIRANHPTQPVEDDGLYTVDLSGEGAKYKRVVSIDAVDQTTLEALGDAIVQSDRQTARTITCATGPGLPLGHFDVLRFVDPEGQLNVKTVVQSWSIPLDGGDISLTLEVV